ncbi:hypothetical protein N8911_00940 [bacterium]|nr:hypothetical protein [bacterium]MDC1222109.1 hypothetical protein [Salibacteraceae bacterium]
MRITLLAVTILLALASCKEENDSEPIIARVGAEYLPHSELMRMIPNDLTPEDSTELASNIIQNWMNEELMFGKAQYNLVAEQTDIEDQVEKYRKELFIFEYEKEVINQKLDTSISDEEIAQFYDENQEIFQLKDYILKVRYTKLLPNSPDQEEVVKWMKKDDDESKDALLDYCHKYAVNCYIDTNWVFFNQLLRQLPIEVYNKESFLRKGKFVQFTDAEHLYYLYVMDIQSKNTLSPLDLELDRIKGLILNSRKIELLNTIRRSVYREAIRKGNAEKYDEPQIKE